MRLVLLTIPLAIGVGYLLGGRLSNLPGVELRWPWLAVSGVVLQLAPVTGAIGAGLLIASFALLCAFAAMNLQLPGFPLLLVGLVLNFMVIGANQGMPVTRHALIASHQQATLYELTHSGGAKHHLAASSDVLLPLADAIPIDGPIHQAVSIGDIATHLGIAWFVVGAMRRRRRAVDPPIRTLPVVHAKD